MVAEQSLYRCRFAVSEGEYALWRTGNARRR